MSLLQTKQTIQTGFKVRIDQLKAKIKPSLNFVNLKIADKQSPTLDSCQSSVSTTFNQIISTVPFINQAKYSVKKVFSEQLSQVKQQKLLSKNKNEQNKENNYKISINNNIEIEDILIANKSPKTKNQELKPSELKQLSSNKKNTNQFTNKIIKTVCSTISIDVRKCRTRETCQLDSHRRHSGRYKVENFTSILKNN